MLLKKTMVLIFLCIWGIMSSACGVTEPKKITNVGYKVVDDTGFVFYMPKPPQRIVSLTYGTDEILFGLVSPQKIVALSRWADDTKITFLQPKDAKLVQGRSVESIESILGFNPDLVIVSTATNPDLVKNLRLMDLKVYVACSPQNLEEMSAKIQGISKVVAEETKGQMLIAQMQQRIDKVATKLQPISQSGRKTVMAMSYIGAIGRSGSLLDAIFQKAKLRNSAAEQGLCKGSSPLSKEKIIAANPEIVLLPTWSSEAVNNPENYKSEFLKDPALQNIRALRNRQVHMFSDKYRYVASQHIAESIEELARLAYPELFSLGE